MQPMADELGVAGRERRRGERGGKVYIASGADFEAALRKIPPEESRASLCVFPMACTRWFNFGQWDKQGDTVACKGLNPGCLLCSYLPRPGPIDNSSRRTRTTLHTVDAPSQHHESSKCRPSETYHPLFFFMQRYSRFLGLRRLSEWRQRLTNPPHPLRVIHSR